MLISDLLQLIQQGEGANMECKTVDVRADKMAKEIVAFANMNGGKILIGVTDDGSINGIKYRSNLQEWLMDTVIKRYVHPFIFVDYEEVTIDALTVAIVTVPQGNAKPYVLHHNDRQDVYVRYGNTCQLAEREQVARLFAAGGLLSAEKFPVHGSHIEELDERRYREYFARIFKERNIPNQKTLMQNRSFLVGEQEPLQCSYFAYILFAKSPRLRLPQAGVRVTMYPGNDKDYNTSFDETIDLPLLGYQGNLTDGAPVEIPLHQKIMALLQPFISKEQLQGKDMKRDRVWDYPLAVIRELLVNAFIHRDWTKQNYVRVLVYDNRMEFISPGALPNGITVESIRYGEQTPRNPTCVRIFREYGYLEDQGMGISRTVIPLMMRENGKEPDFEATQNYFKVTLWKK